MKYYVLGLLTLNNQQSTVNNQQPEAE